MASSTDPPILTGSCPSFT